jgi:hypothetical protein
MKTAIQQLIIEIENRIKKDDGDPWYGGLKYALRVVKSYQIKEKQQIIDAYWHGVNGDLLNPNAAEKYYNETFNQQ